MPAMYSLLRALFLCSLLLFLSPIHAGLKTKETSKAERKARKRGCILKFYPTNPKEPWPTSASSNGVYHLAAVVKNRKRGSKYENVYFSFQKPTSASWAGEPRAKPALPNATLIPPFLPGAWWLYGPFDLRGGKRQYVKIAYTLSPCSPPILWNLTTSLIPVFPFQRPPSEALPETCLGYAYGVSYKKGKDRVEEEGRFTLCVNAGGDSCEAVGKESAISPTL